MAANESKIPVGTILVGKYRVVREIGRGGMAAVYEAEQLSLGKKVAVKVLASELAASTIVIERFFREARAAASVRSPYIVDVYDSGRLDDGRPFITMEMLEGESLYDRMARVRIIDVDMTVRVIVHTAKGLMKAHSAGIVHRDLKPENIFLTKSEDGDDVCKILDFGLAKFYAPVNPEDKAQKRLTREGAVFGTPAYMSPEQVKGQGNVDHRADLWALGCMAYECLIGRPVWNMDQGVAMTFAAIATSPIPLPSHARPDLPNSFDLWFRKCLERDPDRRYQSAKELADAFVEAWGRPTSGVSFPHVAAQLGSGYNARFGAPAADGAALADMLEPAPGSATGRNASPPMTNGGGRPGSVASDASLPLVQRPSVEVSPASQDAPMSRPKPSAVRIVLSIAFLVGSASLAAFVWVRFLSPQVFAPIVRSTTSATPSGASSGTAPLPPLDEPKWVPIISEGQRLFTQGDVKAAQLKFKEVAEMGGPAANIGKVFAEQTARATEKPTGACKAVAFSRPRIVAGKAERPAIAAISKGALVTWVDDHQQANQSHIYGVVIDSTGKATSPVRDLTLEATDAERPQLATVGSDRLVLLYWEEKGKEAGVRARLIDGDGRIDQSKGREVRVGGTKPGQFWPSIDKGPEGFWVVWQDDRDKDGEYDLFARHLSDDLDTLSAERRLTDYVAPPKGKTPAPRVRLPSVAVVANTLLVSYRLDKNNERTIQRLRVPLDLAEKGLDESKDPSRTDRFVGDVSRVSDEKVAADAPATACGNEGCFVAWHTEGVAYVAMIEPKENRLVWKQKIDKGARPSLGVNNGQVSVAYYEKGVIKFSLLSGDGPTTPAAQLFRIHDAQNPRPSIAPGANKNEWYITWQDSDVKGGVQEIYAARLSCGR